MNETGAGRSTTIGEIVLPCENYQNFPSPPPSLFFNDTRNKGRGGMEVEGLIENPSVTRLFERGTKRNRG